MACGKKSRRPPLEPVASGFRQSETKSETEELMKIVTLALIAAGLLLAQDKKAEARTGTAKGTTGAASAPALPAGAKEVEPGLYRYTDAQGKTWLYRNTPFGLAKWEDKPVTAPVVEPVVPVSITDLGDSVQFERQTP